MTVESDIIAALSSLVTARVYPDAAPPTPTRPYIVYQQVGGEAPTFLERAVPSKKNGRFQVNVWATTRIQAAALAVQAETAMTTATAFQCKPLGAFISLYEEDTQLRGTTQDFSVWSTR
jgi:hypothetical protein